ncbi:MAG: sensor domain-containing diguanylate cyclase, partial [Deltaproteobacteria bacterium]|nr:sensor domain-containing diguanylate cyclase [Deltaproteobacteria bacterium]
WFLQGVKLAKKFPDHLFAPAAALLAGVLTGSALYFYFKSRVIRKLANLEDELFHMREGDITRRLHLKGTGEFKNLHESVNTLLSRITDLQSSVIDSDQVVKWAHREIKLTEEIEAKSRKLEDTNRSLTERVRELSILFDISKVVISTIDLNELLKKICEIVGVELKIDHFTILLADRMDALKVKATYGMPEDSKIINLRFERGEGIVGHILETGEMVYLSNVKADPRFMHFKGKFRMEGSFLALPIKHSDKMVGVMTFSRKDIDAFSYMEINFLKTISNLSAMAISNAQLYQQTKKLAIHDPLTSLYNMRFFLNRLDIEWDRAKRENLILSLAILDLDHFKSFNDCYGHLYGDELLTKFSSVLTKNTRKIDTVARYGGDEFIILFPSASKEAAHEAAEKIRKSIESAIFPQPPGVAEAPRITASLGVATLSKEISSSRILIQKADEALIKAKTLGRNIVVVSE